MCLRRGSVAAAWSVWTLAALVLSVISMPLVTEEGPSRFLYLPAAGVSVLLALLLTRIGRWRGHTGKAVVVTLASLLAFSAYNAHRKGGAVSLYLLGLTHWQGGDREGAAPLLEAAANTAPDVIPLYNTMLKLCEVSVGPDMEPPPALQTALRAFPNQKRLLLFELALRTTSADSVVQSVAENTRSTLFAVISTQRALKCWPTVFTPSALPSTIGGMRPPRFAPMSGH